MGFNLLLPSSWFAANTTVKEARMRKRLLPLLIVAALMFGGPVAYGKVSPELMGLRL